MNRKPGNCAIKLPDIGSFCNDADAVCNDGSSEAELSFKKRQQLINFGHSQWGKNNWSWSVTNQDLDFTDYSNGNFTAGVAAFVTVTVNTLGIHRADVGYGTSVAAQKGSAIYRARKSAVTNALRETLFSFGGNLATCLYELLDVNNSEIQPVASRNESEDTKTDFINRKQNANLEEPKNFNTKNAVLTPAQLQRSDAYHQKEPKANGNPRQQPTFTNGQYPAKPAPAHQPPLNHFAQPSPANQANKPPANQAPVKAPPVPSAPLPPAPVPQPPHLRSNSNVSFVLQPVVSGLMPGMMQPFYSMQCAAAAPHTPPPSRMPLGPAHIYPNAYFAEYAPWHLTCDNFERHHGNVNLNINMPPKNLVVNGRPECKNICSLGNKPAYEMDPLHVHGGYVNHQPNPTWIKPTIFYDGFWTEQKVKKWVSEQSDKPSNEDASNGNPNPSNSNQNQPCHSKA